jgi:hypothetical protein
MGEVKLKTIIGSAVSFVFWYLVFAFSEAKIDFRAWSCESRGFCMFFLVGTVLSLLVVAGVNAVNAAEKRTP